MGIHQKEGVGLKGILLEKWGKSLVEFVRIGETTK